MTLYEIDPAEVQVGDRVRVTYEAVANNVGVAGAWATTKAGFLAYLNDPDAEVTLLDRRLPPIPTDEGVMLRSKVDPNVAVARMAGRWRYVNYHHPEHSPSDNITREHWDVYLPEQVQS